MLNGTWCAPTASYHLLNGSLMLDDLEFDDSDSPAIGLVPPGVSWAQVRDHIKIAHHSLLVPPPAGGGDFAGAYWTGTEMVVIDDLGPDQGQAIDDFRATLQDLGET
jgi:hypothetical protein